MTSAIRLILVVIFCAAYLRARGVASEAPFSVGPWVGDNAVMPGLDHFDMRTPEVELFRGTGSAPLITSSLLPKTRLRARSSGDGWRFTSDAFNENRTLWVNGASMTLVLTDSSRKISPLTFTNVRLGPVWVARVRPRLDSHELPVLSPEARERVWVLVLTNEIAAVRGGRWRSAGELERSKETNFCGLPRALANLLVGDSRIRGVCGLVLIPFHERSFDEQKYWRRLDNDSLRTKTEADAVIDAARTANLGKPDGAEARFIRAYAAYLDRANVAKLEGKIVAPFPEHGGNGHRWTEWSGMVSGEILTDWLPFRSHGMLW